MKKLSLFYYVIGFLTILSCSKNTTEDSDFSLYEEHIVNFSTGIISVNDPIRIGLTEEVPNWSANKELDDDLFTVTPSVSGKVMALSSNTVSFIPNEPLDQNQKYTFSFNLQEVKKVKKELARFNFSVKTIKQDFAVTINDLQSYNKDYQYLNVRLISSDVLDKETAKKLIEVTQKDKKLKVKIGKKTANNNEYEFIIDSIKREVLDDKILVSWDGSAFDIDQKGTLEYEIPGKSNFKLIKAELQNDNNQVLLLNFSDPLRNDQNFSGLVNVQNAGNLKFATQGNTLKVFFSEVLKGELLVEVFQGIQSEDGYKMKNKFSELVSFSQVMPAVRFVKSGTILPSSNNLKINFEAVNLSAVNVKVYKIYKNNILQFLQENNIDGNRNLQKVAKPIAIKKVVLKNGLTNLAAWKAYAIDLSQIINPEPGAIYRVEINFNKKYSLYKCTAEENEEAQENENEFNIENEEVRSVNSYYDDYYYDDYNWYDRDNPCTNSYYYNNSIGTNVIASDLGVIAKRGENGKYTFAVNNIVTTLPIASAQIELFDYQQQKLGTVTTDNDGFASIAIKKYAYFAVVTKDKNTTYVKLDEGQPLSVSNFDVSGIQLEKGLKGYLYGERGVWRPGDTLHLSFMLNDNDSKLEKNHPIKLKISDPRGKLTYQYVQKYNEQNHYKFTVITKDTDITGNWEAKITVGGANFYKSIKIETIKPNRLKIKNSFAEATISGNNANYGTLQVNWLHGAVAKDVKVEMQAKFLNQVTEFKGYANYDFDDEVRNFSSEELNIYSGKVDENGKANITLKPTISNQAPGKLKIVMQTKAYENGGDFSTDMVSANYSPYKSYVGLKSPEPNKYGMLETEKMNRFDILTVNEFGKPTASSNLEVRIYKVDWRWWWNSQDDNLSQYNSANSNTIYKRYNLSTNSSGKTSFQFKVPEGDWGRYLIRVVDTENGHATSTTEIIDWPYWSGKTKNGDASTANMLVFTTDKKEYAVNETATVSFPSTAQGRALISIENGSNVIKTLWANTEKGETKVSIPITPDMAPNVYIHISLLKPHASTLSDTPIRMYGIIPIEVIDKNTILEPVIAMPSVLKPEKEATITVSEKSGNEMTYTIAVVDEGLLDLTRFKTPNAWNDFYSKQALGVKTWDVYDDVIGAYGGKINQIFSIGGDEDLGGGKAKKANRFKPVVIYLGPFTLKANSKQTHKINMPNYVGSVRTMVVAGNAKTNAYGKAEQTTPVRNPLMVLASVPRKITPNEKITLPVTVFALENQIKNVSVEVKTNNGIRVLNGAKQNVSFASPDEKMLYFELEVADITGIGKIEVIAKSGKEVASFPVEIQVVNPNPETTDYVDIILEPQSSKSINWESFGVAGTNKAQIEISSFPTIDFNRRLKYLIQYPHGCVEQTTSSVFPQLYLADVVEIDDARKKDIQRNMNNGITRLGGFQQADGGLSYWPGNGSSDDWGTSYAGHFLLEAEKKGYVLPIGFKPKWLSYQKNQAKRWRYEPKYHNDFAQAYRLYTLTLAGNADLSSMNRLKETSGISKESKLRLAVSYAILGQKQTALRLINDANSDTDSQNNSYYYYGSEDRNRAMLLETLLAVNDTKGAFVQANLVAKSLSSSEYMSTQTTAYSLYAMSQFALKNGSKGINVNMTSRGKNQSLTTTKSIISQKLSVINGQNQVALKNNSTNNLYVRVINSGVLPVGEEKEVQKNLQAIITYRTKQGAAINLNNIPQGSEIIAQIQIRNTTSERVENLALTQIIPSGFEIMNSRFTDFGSAVENKADYIDIRDDRTHFYFDLGANETKTYSVLVNASYLGHYYLPGMQCEAMYDDNYIVRNKGQWITIVKN